MSTPGSAWPDFTPHGFCLAWDPGLILLQAGSDIAIAAAYFSIPLAMVVFLRKRRDIAFRPLFALFAAFILACGATHVLGAVTLWHPVYWLDGWVKLLAASLSVTSAVVIWPLLPEALALPSPKSLQSLNDALERQIAERDAAMAKLRGQERQLRQLYARSPAVLHAVDERGVILDVSDRWLDLLGYTRAEVIGRKIFEFYAPDSRRFVNAHIEAVKNGTGRLKTERQVICASGAVLSTEATISLEWDGAGKLERVLVSLTDVTARNQAEQALRASEDRLRHAQKMEAVGQLTGGIAHDFNNLLTTIMASLELLERRPGLDDKGQRLAENALEGARRAAGLTSQLLVFSRQQRLAPERLDPQAVVDALRPALEASVGKANTLLVAPAMETLWPVLADRNQLEMALRNLVLNARDAIAANARTMATMVAAAPNRHGQPRGQVAISFCNLTLDAADLDHMPSHQMTPGDFVSIAVSDTGCGMPPEILARVFEPFFTTKRSGAGSGLGLAQTYGFATQSGGNVRITSTVGQGTRVEIILPRAGNMAAAGAEDGVTDTEPPANAPAAMKIGRGRIVLLVEDDALLRYTVATALEAHGFTMLTAANAADAISILHGHQPIDLLFTDVMMPGGINGVDLAHAARVVRPALPVIFATGYSDRQVLARWTDALELLAKPYTLDEAAQRISQCLRAAAGGAVRLAPI